MIWEQRQRMLGDKAGEVNRRYKLLCACSVDLEGNCVDTDQDGLNDIGTPLEPQAWIWCTALRWKTGRETWAVEIAGSAGSEVGLGSRVGRAVTQSPVSSVPRDVPEPQFCLPLTQPATPIRLYSPRFILWTAVSRQPEAEADQQTELGQGQD